MRTSPDSQDTTLGISLLRDTVLSDVNAVHENPQRFLVYLGNPYKDGRWAPLATKATCIGCVTRHETRGKPEWSADPISYMGAFIFRTRRRRDALKVLMRFHEEGLWRKIRDIVDEEVYHIHLPG